MRIRGSSWFLGAYRFGVASSLVVASWLGAAACGNTGDGSPQSQAGSGGRGAGEAGDRSGGGKAAAGRSAASGTSGEAPGGAEGSGDTDGGRAGSAGATTTGDEAKRDACMKYLLAGCTRLAECNGSRAELSSCMQQALPCPEFLFAEGSTRRLEDLEACTVEHRQLDCATIADGPSCATPGTKAPGAPCIFGVQCSSMVCRRPETGQCGVCATPAVTGDSCKNPNVQCPTTDVCLDGVCTRAKARDPVPKLLDVGRSCTETAQCLFGLICDTVAKFSPQGTCQPLPKVGQPCRFEPGLDHPSCAGVCDVNGMCQPLPGFGEPCDATYGCDASSICQTSSEGMRCGQRAKLGEPCVPKQDELPYPAGTCEQGLYCGRCSAGLSQGCSCVSIYEINRPTPGCSP